jgi:hypothetical protein
MGASVHAFVQYPNDFDTLACRLSKKYYVATLRKLSIAFSNRVNSRGYLRARREATKGPEQLANVGVTLWLPPVLQRVRSNLSHVSVRCGGKFESCHSC